MKKSSYNPTFGYPSPTLDMGNPEPREHVSIFSQLDPSVNPLSLENITLRMNSKKRKEFEKEPILINYYFIFVFFLFLVFS